MSRERSRGRVAPLSLALLLGASTAFAQTAAAPQPPAPVGRGAARPAVPSASSAPRPSASASASVAAGAAAGAASGAPSGAPSGTPSTPTGAASADGPVEPARPTIASGSLTADQAAAMALKSSRTVAVDEAKLRAAGAQVDSAWANFLPRLSFTARYTRLSDVGQISMGPINFVGTPVPVTDPPTQVTSLNQLVPFSVSFTPPLNQYLLQASLLVPLSDYVFRIYNGHKAALDSEEAARWTLEVTKAAAATDARAAFYNVLRGRAGILIARSAVEQTKSHLKDLKSRYELKVVTLADVTRIEAQLAAAELAVTRTQSLIEITEANLRIQLHVASDTPLSLAENLDAEVPPLTTPLASLRAKAFANRPELKALDAQIQAMTRSRSINEASYYPQLAAVGNLTYANPNQRIFPQTDKWVGTWDATLQLTWSPNDILTARNSVRSSDETLATLKTSRKQIEDGLELDVVNAYTKVKETEAAVLSGRAEMRATEESYRVRREQFSLGTATSSLLLDAESELTRARLNDLNARVDLRIARAQLRRAIGEAIAETPL